MPRAGGLGPAHGGIMHQQNPLQELSLPHPARTRSSGPTEQKENLSDAFRSTRVGWGKRECRCSNESRLQCWTMAGIAASKWDKPEMMLCTRCMLSHTSGLSVCRTQSMLVEKWLDSCHGTRANLPSQATLKVIQHYRKTPPAFQTPVKPTTAPAHLCANVWAYCVRALGSPTKQPGRFRFCWAKLPEQQLADTTPVAGSVCPPSLMQNSGSQLQLVMDKLCFPKRTVAALSPQC